MVAMGAGDRLGEEGGGVAPPHNGLVVCFDRECWY